MHRTSSALSPSRANNVSNKSYAWVCFSRKATVAVVGAREAVDSHSEALSESDDANNSSARKLASSATNLAHLIRPDQWGDQQGEDDDNSYGIDRVISEDV